jgi:general secretion pathway protein G
MFCLSSRNRRRARARRGMTLMEIMVVIAILGTIMTVVAVNVLEVFGESNVENTKIQMASMDNMLTIHRATHKNKYPASLDEVKKKFKNGEVPMDAWGGNFEYSCSDDCRGYKMVSFGEDGKSGGSDKEADIVSNSGKIQ